VFITMECDPPEIRLGDGDAHVLKQLQSGLYKHQILCPSKEASNNQVGENAQAEVCRFSDNAYKVLLHAKLY